MGKERKQFATKIHSATLSIQLSFLSNLLISLVFMYHAFYFIYDFEDREAVIDLLAKHGAERGGKRKPTYLHNNSNSSNECFP